MRYYISDSHFFHGAMNFSMDNRGFAGTLEMNDYMIKKWNSVVRKNDEIVILGDLIMTRNLMPQDLNDFIKRLNGRKFLITGNHDSFVTIKGFDTRLFEEIIPYKVFNDNKRKVVCSHYPIVCYEGQYKDNTYMLHGHVHNTKDEDRLAEYIKMQDMPCNLINCFCMYSDYVPQTLDQWIEITRKRKEVKEIG